MRWAKGLMGKSALSEATDKKEMPMAKKEKTYYNPATSQYVKKKGKLPPEYKEIVANLNRAGIQEKRLINTVLRGEKSVEQLIKERKSSSKASRNLLKKEEKTRLFEKENLWLTILKSFGCKISEHLSVSKITSNIRSVFNAYYEKRRHLPLLSELYEQQYGADKAKELFGKFTSFASLGNLNSYKHLHVLLNELKKRLLNVFGPESEICSFADEVSRIRFYDILDINFGKLIYAEGFTEEEKKDLNALFEALFTTEDVPALKARIDKKLENHINNLKKRFMDAHDELYTNAGYSDKFKEFEGLKVELKTALESHSTCTLEDDIHLAYRKVFNRRIIKPDHLSVKKVEISTHPKIKCKVCRVEKPLSGSFPDTEIPKVSQILTELHTTIDEVKKLKSKIEATDKRASVQIADIELTVDSLRKIFSSIKEVNKKYGLKYFADVLKGSKNKKVRERKGEKLPAYGLLSKNRVQDVEDMLRELVRRNFLSINEHYDAGVYYPLVGMANKAQIFLSTAQPIDESTGTTPVVFGKDTIVRTFNQFDDSAKGWILEKLTKDQDIKTLKELFRHIEGKERQSLVENAIEHLQKPCLEPFLLNIFNFGNGRKNEDVEKLKLVSCDYFLKHPDKKLSPIFKLKLAKEKYPAVKEQLQEIVTVLEK